MKKLPHLIAVLILLALAGGALKYHYDQQNNAKRMAAQVQLTNEQNQRRAEQVAVKAKSGGNSSQQFNKAMYSLDDPASIWVVVNKQRPLTPKNYVPSDLVTPKIPLRLSSGSSEMLMRQQPAAALEKMSDAAIKDKAYLMVASAYRSYNLQVSVYGSEVSGYGQAKADSESARPGYSEHQTGLAVDLEPSSRSCEVADCFATTTEGKWLIANAYSYGFIKRYPDDKTPITGYRGEAWHFRYVGTELATEMHKQGISTLEEFFSLSPAPSY